MLIGELAQKTGLSKDTIRFYEKIGLIMPSHRKVGSGYKEYDDATIDRLVFIGHAKALGFTLKEIEQAINPWREGEFSKNEKLQILKGKIHELDQKIEQFNNIRNHLITKLNKVEQGLL